MKGLRKRRLAGLLAVGVVAAVLLIVFRHELDLGARMQRAVAWFRAAGPWPFFIAMALLPAAGFPLSFFTIAAGPVFGGTWGVGGVIAFSLCAVVVNVALSYWIAVSALRPVVVRLLRWFGAEVPELQPEAAWPAIVVLRIVPGIPFWLQSYALGLARVPFRAYMIVSTIVPAGYITATVLLGDGLVRRDPWAIGIAVGLFFVVGTVMHFMKKRYQAARRARLEKAARETRE